jgi:pantoate--beta-alanine ligase
MKTITGVADLKATIKNLKITPAGFVPTMGALHNGHLSLVSQAVSDCPLVVVSIFVNPTQFNDKNDLKNYPRTPESDLTLLSTVLRENDIVFMPDAGEIYPEEDKRVFRFGNLDMVMEALHRPGHFNGVAQVVSRLFEIVDPDYAYFGQKDFQQLAVIKSLVKQCGFKVKIIGKPIIREKDGLAMSSRNTHLEPEIRKNAPVIFESLRKATLMINNSDIPAIRSFVINNINSTEGFTTEYFEIVDDTELIPVYSKATMNSKKHYFGCVAVKAGKIRLIDNIEFELAGTKKVV